MGGVLLGIAIGRNLKEFLRLRARQAVPRLEALVGGVLLGEAGRGLLWGHRLLHRLLQLFLAFDFTVAGFVRGLQARPHLPTLTLNATLHLPIFAHSCMTHPWSQSCCSLGPLTKIKM